MARSIEQERVQLEADAKKLGERRRLLADRERAELMKEVEKSGMFKGDPDQIRALLAGVKKLGMAEAAKRLTA